MSIVVVVTAFPVPEHRAEVRCELWVISGVLRPPFLRKRRAAGAICKDRILKIVPILANPRSALMQVIVPGKLRPRWCAVRNPLPGYSRDTIASPAVRFGTWPMRYRWPVRPCVARRPSRRR